MDRGGVVGAEPRRRQSRNGHAHLIYLLGGWIRTDFGDSVKAAGTKRYRATRRL